MSLCLSRKAGFGECEFLVFFLGLVVFLRFRLDI